MALGAAFVLRIQLAPAIAFLALWFCRFNVRDRWLPAIAGGLAPVLLYGLCDWVMIGRPFQSMYNYFVVNLLQDKASYYGVSPWYMYGWFYLAYWSVFIAPAVFAFFASDSRWRALGYAGLVIIVSHALIPHKEYRFVYPASLLLGAFAAYGTVDALQMLLRRADQRPALAIAGMAVAIWTAGGAAIATLTPVSELWQRGRAEKQAFAFASVQPDICGLGLALQAWWNTPGTTGLYQRVPLYLQQPGHRDGAAAFVLAQAQAFNVLIAQGSVKIVAPFEQQTCFAGLRGERLCVYRRTGGCTASDGGTFNDWLSRTGQ